MKTDKYDETYTIVVSMAKTKMLMNAHKGNIEDLEINTIIDKAKEELEELRDALGSGDNTAIIAEVADVLNFTVAAAHKAITSYRNRKKDKPEGPDWPVDGDFTDDKPDD